MAENDRDGHYLHVGGDVSGQILVGTGNAATMGPAENAVDLSRLTEFARAVGQALPVLGVSEEQRRAAEELVREIVAGAGEPAADHRRLRTLGQSLRVIVEGAAAGALTSGLFSIWVP
ncbi:hypothetical protein ACRYCC_41195 [Actinomadura scrupuli]|uniref:hypothetical protein n=1 Tax=Actinomadura scrupuli TaxID=559629 RepID=UPI003D957602